MDRKDALKTLGLTTIGSGLFLKSLKGGAIKSPLVHKDNVEEVAVKQSYIVGRQKWELERLKKLQSEPDFFTKHEMRTITVLGDIIIPKDNISGSASDAKVPEFIAFIVKDMPEHQTPMRGGLKWLDVQCRNGYGNVFVDCSKREQLEMVEAIAYPGKAKPEMQPGVAFFNRMRSLTASGFYTTKMGIKDIGYKGNHPTQWKGVPADVLANYDVKNFEES
jgi:hypothetical protein